MVGVVLGATAVLTIVGLVMAGAKGATAFTQASFQAPATLHAVRAAIWRGLRLTTLDPNYWAFVAFLTLCQWLWPAQRDQRNNFSVEMAVDAVWFVMGNAMQFTVVAVTLGAVTVAYAELLGTWSLNLQPLVGFWGLAIFAFVATDGLAWLSHWCHHKVRTLWRFHAVHHSQQRLNALSDNRTHVGEVVFAALIVFVPSQLLGLNAATSMGLAFIGIYYSAMLHSNVRTNLGPFRYLFMGPQAHRVHHSIEPQYYERNFGTVFPWWDFMAGTYYWGVNEYPATGITDQSFPLRDRRDLNPLKWVVIFFKQLTYPFAMICRDVAAWVSASFLPQPALLMAGAGGLAMAAGVTELDQSRRTSLLSRKGSAGGRAARSGGTALARGDNHHRRAVAVWAGVAAALLVGVLAYTMQGSGTTAIQAAGNSAIQGQLGSGVSNKPSNPPTAAASGVGGSVASSSSNSVPGSAVTGAPAGARSSGPTLTAAVGAPGSGTSESTSGVSGGSSTGTTTSTGQTGGQGGGSSSGSSQTTQPGSDGTGSGSTSTGGSASGGSSSTSGSGSSTGSGSGSTSSSGSGSTSSSSGSGSTSSSGSGSSTGSGSGSTSSSGSGTSKPVTTATTAQESDGGLVGGLLHTVTGLLGGL